MANLISTIGGSMSLVALPWFVFSITHDATLTGLAATCETAAVVVASTFAGWFVARLGPRAVRVLSDVVSGIAVLAVPVLFEVRALPFALLLALVAVNGLLRTPAVAASFVLLRGVAAQAGTTTAAVSGPYVASLQLAGAIGAPLAGATIALLGAPMVLVVDAVTFIISAVLVQISIPEQPAAANEGEHPSVLAALRLVWRVGALRALVGVSVLLSAIGALWGAVLAPLYGTVTLHSPAALGLVLALSSVGAILGAWTAPRLQRRIRLSRLAPTLVASSVLPLFVAIATSAPVQLLSPAALISGYAIGAFGTVFVTIEYAVIPAEQQGHVFGVLTALRQAGAAAGPLVGGALISATSPPTVSWAAVAVGVLLASGLLLARSLHIDVTEASPTRPQAGRSESA